MKKTKKALILTSALATTALCASLVTGATFALFTSESNVDIAVTAGKVNVTASMTDLKTASMDVEQENGNWANGGKATINGNTLTLDKITPGDSVSFNIKVDNSNTDIAAMYRLSYVVKDGYMLAEGLDVSIDGMFDNTKKYKNYTSEWKDSIASTIAVTVTLPNHEDTKLDSMYMGLSTGMNFTVEAVQANGAPADSKPSFEMLPDYTELKEAVVNGEKIVKVSADNDFALRANWHRNVLSGIYVLTQNVTGARFDTLCVSGDEKVVIDLNGYKLTRNIGRDGDYYASGTQISQSGSLTIENGTFASVDGNYVTQTNLSAIVIKDSGSLTMNDVDFSAYSGIFVAPQSTVLLDNCSMTVRDPYSAALATNASGNYSPTLVVKNTEITSAGSGLMINVGGNLTVENCDITAGFQCVQARGGNVTVSDCKLTSKASKQYWDSLFARGGVWANRNKTTIEGQHNFLMEAYSGKAPNECTQAWGSSNAVAPGCLVVGNYKNNSYAYNATCTVTNTEFATEKGMESWTIVLSGHPKDGITDTLDYDGTVAVTKLTQNNIVLIQPNAPQVTE